MNDDNRTVNENLSVDLIRDALITGLNAVLAAGWTRHQEQEEKDIQAAIDALDLPTCKQYLQVQEAVNLLQLGLDKDRYDGDMEPKVIAKWYWQYVQNLEVDAKKALDMLVSKPTEQPKCTKMNCECHARCGDVCYNGL